MKPTLLFSLAPILFACSASFAQASEDDKTAPNSDKPLAFDIEYAAAIEPVGGSYQVQVTPDGIPAGKKGRISLQMHNATDRDFAFDTIGKSCGCVDVVAEQMVLKAGDTMPVTILLDAPSFMSEKAYYIQIQMYYATGQAVSVYLTLDLAGVLSFTNRFYQTKVERGATEHAFKVPIRITQPIEPNALEYIIDESLGEIDCSFEALADGSQFIVCKAKVDPDREVNLSFIPTLIVGEYRDSTMRENEEDGKAKLRYFEAERTTHFHWFSVNEEMRDAEFDSALIEGQGLQRLVDPTLSRATSLQGL